jgi:multidrug efflux pump subunit AcrA (membrane-fusion protein)
MMRLQGAQRRTGDGLLRCGAGCGCADGAGSRTPTTSPAAKSLQRRCRACSALEQRDIRAQLAPRRYTTLAAEIGAKVQRLPVVEGAAFRQGQLLVQFDCSLQQAQLNKAQAGWMPPRRPGVPTSAWPS